MKIAVILGTSITDGNTHQLVQQFAQVSGATVFNLSDYDFSFYDYSHHNKDDDYIVLIEKLSEFEHLVFASPVYWYCMSAQMKVFFDRLSDLLTIEKALGRRLKTKSMSVLSTGYDCHYPECFIKPFELTAAYLQMDYKGITYASIQNETDLKGLHHIAVKAFKSVMSSF